jgi:hypothetical protein
MSQRFILLLGLSAALLAIMANAQVDPTVSTSLSWNQIRVQWPTWYTIPKTSVEAEDDGWVQIQSCKDAGSPGYVYIKDNDISAAPIYDEAGSFAGLAVGWTKSHPAYTGFFTQVTLANQTFFRLLSFNRDPSTICKVNRSPVKNVVGDRLWIQSAPGKYVKAPLEVGNESALTKAGFFKGRCLPTMGVHWWSYSGDSRIPCSKFFPVFLLYNKGKLNAWGLAPGENLEYQSSKYFEHPSQSALKALFQSDAFPQCILAQPEISSMHIYYTQPQFNLC